MSSTNHADILIIGNGGAAAHAVMGLRSAGYNGAIDLVAASTGPPFNPMLLPYLLKGDIDREACHPFGSDFYKGQNVNRRLGVPAVGLDAEAKVVTLADGDRIEYGQCLIATGAGCIVPNLPGLPGASRTVTFRTKACGESMIKAAETGKSTVVLGASLVGAKLAEVLAQRGLKVTLVDLADRLLPGATHIESSLTIQKLLEERGVTVLLSRRLSGVKETADSIRLQFEGEGEISADFACVCTGVKPNLEFLNPEQIDIGTGVLVDTAGHTSADGLYAAGDAAEGLNLLTGKHQWFGLWGKACYQGRTAGLNMAGRQAAYPGTLPEYISPLVGRFFAGLGDVNLQGPEVKTLIYKDSDGLVETILTFDNGVLAGANLLAGIDALDRLKTAMIRRLDLSDLINKGQTRLSEILSGITNRTRLDIRTLPGAVSTH
jgi:NADPH-dependent 2,4-dienoyl-CoA reductase/sulfur reductase-like enzyme